MIKPDIPIGVIISTYNNINDLNLVIEGYHDQIDHNFILYIADDGSSAETSKFIAEKAIRFPVPIHHIWHEDKGFRLSAIRNQAIAQAQTPYLIITDGDCIPLPNMIEAHRKYASPHTFLTGGRLLLSKALTEQLKTTPWKIHIEKKMQLIVRVLRNEINRTLPIIMPVSCSSTTHKLHGLKGCHMSFWRKDLLYINGFDESYHGWGREDSDIAARLFHTGIARKNLRGIPLLHLWHTEAQRSSLNNNDSLLAQCLQEKRIQARQGITKKSLKKHHA